ncbi:MAG: hypothetical protein LBF85_00580, partial [Tannerella sp.]|nr:hypothetical protein [Tannerella sp.]
MKQIEKGVTLLLCAILLSAICMWSCSDDSGESNTEPPETPPVVKLSANRTALKANGIDAVVFAVTVNGEDAGAEALVICRNGANATDTVRGNSFSTREAGTYSFYANYKGRVSDEISIDAAAVVVALKADRDTIKANDRDVVRFTVVADEADVTPSAVVTLAGAQDSVLNGASFSAKEPSTYTFYATYEGTKSNGIRIEATEVQYLLTADRTSVLADASGEVRFTVTVDGEDVTSDAAIFQRYEGMETALDAPAFSTENYGTYTFYAVYGGKKTGEVAVDAVYVDRPFLMEHVIMDFTSTICPNCPRMEAAIRKVQSDKSPETEHRIALHMGGKHCDSELSGTMGPVANLLSSDDYFPSVKINLKYVEYLSATTTPNRIVKSINSSKKDRGNVSETGIAIESTVNGTDINFTVKVKSVK